MFRIDYVHVAHILSNKIKNQIFGIGSMRKIEYSTSGASSSMHPEVRTSKTQ